eukprot:jgi/Tetstr1/456966/TSEL_043635.t1
MATTISYQYPLPETETDTETEIGTAIDPVVPDPPVIELVGRGNPQTGRPQLLKHRPPTRQRRPRFALPEPPPTLPQPKARLSFQPHKDAPSGG